MVYLLGSIVLTSYITCVITGSMVNGSFPVNSESIHTAWFRWACVMGILFVSVFNIVGLTTQKLSVAVASVANKLSLIIPVILSVYLYNEKVVGWKAVGVLLALVAVILTCYTAAREKKEELEIRRSKKTMASYFIPLLPFILFIGSGLLDSLINHVQKNYVTEGNSNAYLISGFLSAGVIGSSILIIQYLTGRMRFALRHVIAGILIGIPNYFSIWCLVRFLKHGPWQSSASIPVNNMGIVLFSSVAAWLLFREKLSKINWMGIALSLVAICLIAFGDNL
ncbi:MAG: hypothetical protein NVS3B15_06590 [Sediminibacterium sp.]